LTGFGGGGEVCAAVRLRQLLMDVLERDPGAVAMRNVKKSKIKFKTI
jgi:hypothetical protein